MSQESWRDGIASATRWAHGAQELHIDQADLRGVFQVIPMERRFYNGLFTQWNKYKLLQVTVLKQKAHEFLSKLSPATQSNKLKNEITITLMHNVFCLHLHLCYIFL